MVRLPALGGEWCRGRDGAGSVRACYRQRAACAGEEALEALHLLVDQLRPLWGAGGQGAKRVLAVEGCFTGQPAGNWYRGAVTTQEFHCTFLQASLQPFTFFLLRFKLCIPVVGKGEVVFSFDVFFLFYTPWGTWKGTINQPLVLLFIVARVFS